MCVNLARVGKGKWLIGLALLGGAGPAFSLSVPETVIDFESLASTTTDFKNAGHSYTEDGFQLTNLSNLSMSALRSPGSNNSASYVDSTTLLNNTVNGITQLTREGGGAFNFLSIDLAEFTTTSGAVTVAFDGTTTDGAMVHQIFTTDGSFGLQRFVFPSTFSNLTVVTWVNAAPYHQFDNIVVSTVPLPGGVVLLASALGLLAGTRRNPRA